MKKNYSGVLAVKEHMLAGQRISNLESLLLFGVQDLKSEVRLMRNDGYIIKCEKVSMVKILNRINKIYGKKLIHKLINYYLNEKKY